MFFGFFSLSLNSVILSEYDSICAFSYQSCLEHREFIQSAVFLNLQSFFSWGKTAFYYLILLIILIICILGFPDLPSKSFNFTFMSSHSNSWHFLSFEVVILFEQSSKKRVVKTCSSCHLPRITSNGIKWYLITQVENKNASKCSKDNYLN